jgi:hypothetical protein
MKHRLAIAILSTGLLISGTGAAGSASAAAPAAPGTSWITVASHCSESGDVCYGIKRSGEQVRFALSSFVDFGKVRFCVRKQGSHTKVCHKRDLKPGSHGIFRAKIGWNQNYPTSGSKRRIVTFMQGAPKLSFTP